MKYLNNHHRSIESISKGIVINYTGFGQTGLDRRVVRRRDSMMIRRNRRHMIPAVEALEQKTLMTVTYHGGDFLTHPGVQPLFLGSSWNEYNYTETKANEMSDFLYTLVNSSYMDTLNQYGVSNGSFGTGYFEQYLLSSSISDSQIQWVIAQCIHSGEYYQGNLIVVYTPPGVVVIDGNQNSVNNFTGYHSSFLYYNGYGLFPVAYAVITFPTSPNANPFYTLTPGQEMTVTTSHEVAEACTDTYRTLGFPAWYDNNPPYPQSIAGDEIGDLAWGDFAYLDGYIVQDIVNIYDQPITPPDSTPFLVNLNNSIFPVNSLSYVPEILIAQFSDPDIVITNSRTRLPSSYFVTIDWGDGSLPTSGIVTETYPGIYQIYGYHNYQNYSPVVVQIYQVNFAIATLEDYLSFTFTAYISSKGGQFVN